jgi:hypothetical protein
MGWEKIRPLVVVGIENFFFSSCVNGGGLLPSREICHAEGE